MNTVSINAAELQFIELLRVALSAPDNPQRLRAISNLKHEVAAQVDELVMDGRGEEWLSSPLGAEFLRRSMGDAKARREAAVEFSLTEREFEGRRGLGRGMKLDVAEHIGMRVRLTIKERERVGLHSKIGILEQVRDFAQQHRLFGAQDLDTLRKTWKGYRGVVHLGMAMELYGVGARPSVGMLTLAERIRQELSGHAPRGAKKPYVDESEKISFVISQ